MKKFEYRVIRIVSSIGSSSIQAQLNSLGKIGWELISVSIGGDQVSTFYLKRRIRWWD